MSNRYIDPQDLEHYRLALAAAIRRSSLRAVAATLGMSPTGLSQFVEGTQPYAKTIDKVRRWFLRNSGWEAEKAEHIAEELRQIVVTLPDPDLGVGNLLEAVERSYRSEGLTPPRWVERVKRRIGARATGTPRAGLGGAAVLLSRESVVGITVKYESPNAGRDLPSVGLVLRSVYRLRAHT